MALIDRIRDVPPCDPDDFIPLIVDDQRFGLIKPGFEDVLRRFSDVFQVTDVAVALSPRLRNPADRTAAVSDVLKTLRDEDLITGWRGEQYPVTTRFLAVPVFTMERAAVPFFGTRGYGVHINGFVRMPQGISMWIAKRSKTKPTGPGKLDQIVAGGQPIGIGFTDNVLKECQEEAGIPLSLARTAKPVGTISYLTHRAEGVRNDVLVNYDLELPTDFEPVNTDGEVESFSLLPLDQVRQTLADGDAFKFNCALVALDFFVRWGAIEADDPDYEELVSGLHAPPL